MAKEKPPKIKDLTDSVLSNRILTKFALLVQYSGQGYLLSSRGPFTLFVPTDSAFSRMPPGAFEALQRPENRDVLQRIVLFHIVNGQRLTAKDMAPLKTLLSCEGNPLPLRVNHIGYQIVSKAKIIHADIRCQNGLMDEIDAVLLPPGVSLTALVTAPLVQATTNAMTSPVAATNVAPANAQTPLAEPATNSDSATSAPPVSPP